MSSPRDSASPARPSEESGFTPASATPLRRRIVSGFSWGVGTGVVIQASRAGFAIVLARLLTPHEYGLANMALVVSTLVSALTDLSLGVGLVQRGTITERDRSTVFWTNTILGAILMVAGLALAHPIAVFYEEPEVEPLFRLLCVTFLVGALGATHAALLHREMDFRSINVRVGVSTIVGGAIGIVFAAAGAGAWSLIAQQIAVALISTALLWTSVEWRPRLTFSSTSLREIGAFGGSVFGVRLTDYGRTNLERVLVAKVLGTGPLGTYSVAFNILLSPVGRFLVAVMDTLFPILSRLQSEPARMAEVWLRVNRLFSAAFVPALIGLAVAAPDFVEVVLGDRWLGLTPLLQLLAVGVIAQVVSALGADVLKSAGRAGALLRFSTVEAVLFLVGTLVGLSWGIVGVAAAYGAVSVPTRIYFIRMATRAVGISFSRFAQSLSGIAQASIALLISTSFVRMLLVETTLPVYLRLVIVVLVGVAVYVPVCVWRVPEIASELARMRQDWRTSRTVRIV
jgi:O-antigen/teichoic acid export membrane protein